MSMSLTILESSTITVFTVPSNMRILRGLCFFLYSRVSWQREETHEELCVTEGQNECLVFHVSFFPSNLQSQTVIVVNLFYYKTTSSSSQTHTLRRIQKFILGGFIIIYSLFKQFCLAWFKTVTLIQNLTFGIRRSVCDSDSPHSSTCSSQGPFLPRARCLSWGLHQTETAHSHWLRWKQRWWVDAIVKHHYSARGYLAIWQEKTSKRSSNLQVYIY